MRRATIRHVSVGPPDSRFVLEIDGAEIESGPCAKTLAEVATDQDAGVIVHTYDLTKDDCDWHRLRRVPN